MASFSQASKFRVMPPTFYNIQWHPQILDLFDIHNVPYAKY